MINVNTHYQIETSFITIHTIITCVRLTFQFNVRETHTCHDSRHDGTILKQESSPVTIFH